MAARVQGTEAGLTLPDLSNEELFLLAVTAPDFRERITDELDRRQSRALLRSVRARFEVGEGAAFGMGRRPSAAA
jgi:hypothetical protein